MEKAILSDWLNVIKSASKEAMQVVREDSRGGVESAIPVLEVNKVNSNPNVISIESEDIQDEVKYWSSAMVCYVLTQLCVMEGFFRRIWGKLGIDKIGVVGRGVLIL